MNVIDLVREKGIEPKKASGTNGGEYHSLCPGCGGDDRFHVWPEQNGGNGSWWCRGCGKSGDIIQFLIEFDGCSYPEACAQLEIEPKKQMPFKAPHLPGKPFTGPARFIEPKVPNAPPAIWMERAEKVVSWAHDNLIQNRKQLAWLNARGIGKKSVEKYRLGWNPKDIWRPRQAWGLKKEINEKTGKPKMVWIPAGLVIPNAAAAGIVRIRVRRPQGEPRYYMIPGSSVQMMTATGPERAVVVVESELDMIMIEAVACDIAGAIALGSSSVKPDAGASATIKKAVVVLNAVDFDAAGAKALSWWREYVPNARRWPVPIGKDPGDSYQAGVDIREWITAGFPEAWDSELSLLESKENRVKMDQNFKDFDVTGAAAHASPESAPESKVSDGVKCSAAVAELVGLVRQYPVEILNRPNRLKLIENKSWARKNWEVSKRISELVYMDPDVFNFISKHPEEKITGKNIARC